MKRQSAKQMAKEGRDAARMKHSLSGLVIRSEAGCARQHHWTNHSTMFQRELVGTGKRVQ